jgi:hypothetical protein
MLHALLLRTLVLEYFLAVGLNKTQLKIGGRLHIFAQNW